MYLEKLKIARLFFLKMLMVHLQYDSQWECRRISRNFIKKYDNKKIIALDAAFKKIFSSKNLHENLAKINGEYKENDLVAEVVNFITKDKRRPICTPQSE